MKCLEKQPDLRYRSALELADDLERYARGEETSVRPHSWQERITRSVVAAINHKLPLPSVARWSAIDLWDAGLNLAVNGALFLLIWSDQSPARMWFALLTYYAVWWWMFLTYLFRRNPVDPTDASWRCSGAGFFWRALLSSGSTAHCLVPVGPQICCGSTRRGQWSTDSRSWLWAGCIGAFITWSAWPISLWQHSCRCGWTWHR